MHSFLGVFLQGHFCSRDDIPHRVAPAGRFEFPDPKVPVYFPRTTNLTMLPGKPNWHYNSSDGRVRNYLLSKWWNENKQ